VTDTKRRLKILLLVKPGTTLTGSGTYEATLVRELARRHEVKLYESERDLAGDWDLAHCTNLKHLSFKVARRLRCPLVVDAHDYYWIRYYHFLCPDFPVRFLLQRLRRWKYRVLFRHIDGLILHGQFLYDLFRHPNKYLNFYFGLDYSGIASPPRREREDLILFVGGDYFRKGLPRLLRALPRVLERVPTARLLVIGKEPWHSRWTARMLSRGMPVDYVYGMPREEVYRTYGRGKVLVLPSEIEATPLVIAEAAVAGMPVVVSDVGGHPELVQDGVSGFIFPLADRDVLADRIVRCLTDAALAERLVGGARSFMDRFTIDGMIARIEDIYDDLLLKGKRGRDRGRHGRE
jgi:glycosyltransferase involved in cell wall biosynthesis